MNYYSTNNTKLKVSLKEAVLKGLATDNGLFMPEKLEVLPNNFFNSISEYSLQEIAFEVAKSFFKKGIEDVALQQIINGALNFPIPVKHIHDNIYTLELFHGPTLAFKDVGARFMARIFQYLTRNDNNEINVLVATSGDTGSAVANGFLGIEGIKVTVLYPKNLVSVIQEKQFTTLGQNITALEIEGTFDDCQRLVKTAFLDKKLNEKLSLSSANSINLARLLPQSFYYFYAYSQLQKLGISKDITISVPSGNFGNLTAGLIAKKMGLPIKQFIAATNANNIVPSYLGSGVYSPQVSIATIANAMDVGDPSNFVRMMDLYKNSHPNISKEILGYWYKEDDIKQTMRQVFKDHKYILDPHGAVGYRAVKEYLGENDGTGLFIETAHPAKFKDIVEDIIDEKVEMPERLQKFMKGEKKSIVLPNSFDNFKEFLLTEV